MMQETSAMSNTPVQILIVALAGLSAPVAQAQQTWVLDAMKIYPSPDAPSIGGYVVIAGTKIQSVAPASGKRAEATTQAPQCNGGIVGAGFQNNHFHFNCERFSLGAR